MKALIVDHEAGSRKLLAKIIQKYCQCVTVIGNVRTADEAYKFIQKKQPDVVFLDAELPDGSVVDLLNRLPHQNFEIILTASFEHPTHMTSQCNASDYLMKPINIRELMQVVSNIKKCA